MTAKFIKGIIILTIIPELCGCVSWRQATAAFYPPAHFLVLESDSRVLYEPGAEDIGREIAGYLPGSISTVENLQYGAFPGPVEVYICAMKKSFADLTGQAQVVKGVVTARHVYLSAERLRELPPQIRQAVLTHELSHLHMQQHLGHRHPANLPAWFQEGLAEYVSGGASMYDVSETDAARDMLAGKSIRPDATGSSFATAPWRAYGLRPPMFYRQSFMFVVFLKRLDEFKFRAFLLALQKSEPFGESFNAVYGFPLETAWQQFLLHLRNQYASR